MRDTRVVSDQDRRCLLRLLDAMDEHFDRRVSDQEFLRKAASTRDSLNLSAADDPALLAAVRALEDFLSAGKDGPLPAGPYGSLRFALAELEEPPEGSRPGSRQLPVD
jgi:hypothetical protein